MHQLGRVLDRDHLERFLDLERFERDLRDDDAAKCFDGRFERDLESLVSSRSWSTDFLTFPPNAPASLFGQLFEVLPGRDFAEA